jgi:hypothetical protein
LRANYRKNRRDQQLVLMFLHELQEWLNARPDPVQSGTDTVVPLRKPTA